MPTSSHYPSIENSHWLKRKSPQTYLENSPLFLSIAQWHEKRRHYSGRVFSSGSSLCDRGESIQSCNSASASLIRYRHKTQRRTQTLHLFLCISHKIRWKPRPPSIYLSIYPDIFTLTYTLIIKPCLSREHASLHTNVTDCVNKSLRLAVPCQSFRHVFLKRKGTRGRLVSHQALVSLSATNEIAAKNDTNRARARASGLCSKEKLRCQMSAGKARIRIVENL